MTVEELKLKITADTSNAKKGLKEVNTSANDLGKTGTDASKGFANGLAGVCVEAAAVVAAIKAVIDVTKDLVGAYQVQLESELKLESIMKNRLGATDEAIDSIKQYCAALQETGLVGDEVAMQGAAQLAIFVNNAEDIKKLLPTLEDLAAFNYGTNITGENMASLARSIKKAVEDNSFRSLENLGVIFSAEQEERLKAMTTQSDKLAYIMSVINDRMGGYNLLLANTPMGAVAQMQNAWGDLKEVLGEAIAPMVIPIVQGITADIQAFMNLIAVIQAAINKVKEFFGISSGRKGDTVNKSTKSAAKATGDMAANLNAASVSAGKTAKALRGIAGIDELTRLTEANLGGGAVGSVGAAAATAAEINQSIEDALNNYEPDIEVKSFWDRFWDVLLGSEENGTARLARKLIQKIQDIDWNGVGESIKEGFNGAIEWVKTGFDDAWTWIGENASEIWTNIKTKSVTLTAKFVDSTAKVRENINNAWNNIKDKSSTLSATVKDKAAGVTDKINGVWEKVVTKSETLTALVVEDAKSVRTTIQDAWKEIVAKNAQLSAKVIEESGSARKTMVDGWNTLKDKKATLTATVKDGASSVSTKIGTLWDKCQTKTAELTANLKQTFKDEVLENINTSWATLKDKKVTLICAVKEEVAKTREAVVKAWDIIKDKKPILTATAKDAASNISNKISDLWDKCNNKSATLNANLNKNFDDWGLQNIVNQFSTVKNVSGTATFKSSIANGLSAFIDKWNSVTNKTIEIKTVFNNALTTAWNNFVNRFNNSINTINQVPGVNITWRLPTLATGGITNGATTALIGEAGKEAVLPLENNTGWMDKLAEQLTGKMGNNGFEGALNITLNVGGKEFGKACINSINEAQSAAGAILLNI